MSIKSKFKVVLLSVFAFIFLLFGVTFLSVNKVKAESNKGNEQNYKGGKVKFLDELFTDSTVLTVDEANAIVNNSLDQSYLGDINYSTLIDDMSIHSYYNGTELNKQSNKKNLDAGDITGLFIKNGVDSLGNTRYCFVYVGIPYKDANGVAVSATNPVPAVVCIQGAGGTAFSDWVTYWMQKGYAAISIDTEGGVPEKTSAGKRGVFDTHSKLSSNFGGLNMGKSNPAYQDCLPQNNIEDMWFYQAISSAISATTYLRSQSLIDNDRIAITGISYGSYLTCLATAYDGRYCAAVPVYGSLEQHEGDTWFANNCKLFPLASELWDSNDCLRENKVPILYYAGDTDPHFSIESTTLSVKEVPNSRTYIKNEFPHSHIGGIVDSDPTFSYTKVVYDFIGSYCYPSLYTEFGTVEVNPEYQKEKIPAKYGTGFGDTEYYYSVIRMPE